MNPRLQKVVYVKMCRSGIIYVYLHMRRNYFACLQCNPWESRPRRALQSTLRDSETSELVSEFRSIVTTLAQVSATQSTTSTECVLHLISEYRLSMTTMYHVQTSYVKLRVQCRLHHVLLSGSLVFPESTLLLDKDKQ